jgi:hypothetical protein
MSKELKALREMYQVCLVANVADMSKNYELIETALKALEIIKNKGLTIEFIKEIKIYTQEEYELLKEVLL